MKIVEKLKQVWNTRYADFPSDQGRHDVEEAFEAVLQAIGHPVSDLTCHQRYVYIGRAIALAAQPTIKHYFPNEYKSDTALRHVSIWLKNGIRLSDGAEETLFPEINDTQFSAHPAGEEALQIFYNLIKSLDPKQAYEAVVDILYDAMTGDPIIAHSHKKRQLFNWWLIDVVPSAYYLSLPSAYYSKTWPFVAVGTR